MISSVLREDRESLMEAYDTGLLLIKLYYAGSI